MFIIHYKNKIYYILYTKIAPYVRIRNNSADYFEIDPLEGITVPWPSILDTEYLRDSKMVAFTLRFP